ncbi:MAG: hypothetical protein DRN95_08695, partial [Candidatus Hydrothermarchaeota archaeon]
FIGFRSFFDKLFFFLGSGSQELPLPRPVPIEPKGINKRIDDGRSRALGPVDGLRGRGLESV